MRLVQDPATALGSGVNGTVRRIERSYKNSGELEKVTSYDNATGDPYRGLDRFGRVIDQRWHKGGSDLERLEYVYSRVGNRTERKNTEGSHQDEKYTYAEPAKSRRSESGGEQTAGRQFVGNGLYRLDDMERGTLFSGSITDKKFAQDRGGACPVRAGNR